MCLCGELVTRIKHPVMSLKILTSRDAETWNTHAHAQKTTTQVTSPLTSFLLLILSRSSYKPYALITAIKAQLRRLFWVALLLIKNTSWRWSIYIYYVWTLHSYIHTHQISFVFCGLSASCIPFLRRITAGGHTCSWTSGGVVTARLQLQEGARKKASRCHSMLGENGVLMPSFWPGARGTGRTKHHFYNIGSIKVPKF